MKIIVCVKRVPDTACSIRIGPDGKSIDPAGIEYILSPYDEYALEEALRIKEKLGQGEVTVLSLGPGEATSILRTCLAMGADKAILLKDPAPRDPWATAETLAATLKDLPFDLILFGKQAVDDDACQVGSLVAAILGLPLANVVTKVEAAAGKITAYRQIEGGTEVLDLVPPAILTAQKGLNEPRYASLKGIMAAKKKTIEERPAPPAEARWEVLKLEPPPPRPPARIVGSGAAAIPELIRVLREEAKVI